MIYAISLNPAVDRTIYVETLTSDHVNRVQKSFKDPAGRGINVSRVLNSLDVNNQLLTLLAGEKGKFIIDKLSKDHNLIFKEIEGNTRENIKVINQITLDVYSINELGPNVTKEDVFDLLKNIDITENDTVILSGSAPNGINCFDYKSIMDYIINTGAFVFLDTTGDMLVEGIKAKPNVIKPNKDELEHLMGRTYETPEEIAEDSENILKLGVDRVLVTLGEAGSVYVSPRNVYIVAGISVDSLSSVGSGGAYLSGFVYGMQQGLTTVGCLKWAAATSVASATTISTTPAELRRVNEFLARVQIKEVYN